MRYQVAFTVPLEVIVSVDADDEDRAADDGWQQAQNYLETVTGNHRDVRASGDLDGIGADRVTEVP